MKQNQVTLAFLIAISAIAGCSDIDADADETRDEQHAASSAHSNHEEPEPGEHADNDHADDEHADDDHADDDHAGDDHADGAHSDDDHEDDDHADDDHGDDDHADDDHADEIRHSAAHSHGDAKLAVALEASTLYIELDTPLYNLTGFEHEPQTAEDHATLSEAQGILAQPGNLFSINPEAGCSASQTNLEVELIDEAAEDEHDSHDDAHDDHHGEEEADGADNSHRDFVIDYTFDCESPDLIDEIVVHLFERFPRFEELDAVYLGHNNQRSLQLNPSNYRITVAH